MKKIYFQTKIKYVIASIALIVGTYNLQAQIPNSGFEAWTNMGSYEAPNSWGNTNSMCTGSFYPVTKSTDHYPVSVGLYSMQLGNNLSLLPPTSYCGLGVAGSPAAFPGKFPITGHPNSLTGYYKFFPQGGDTMIISVQLFKSGTQVSNAALETTVTATGWTSFNVPFNAYTTADSASIRVSAYCTCGPNNIPHGNSVLKVDNLNFDNLITGISENTKSLSLTIFPNPSSGCITLVNQNPTYEKLKLNIRNSLGQIVYADVFTDSGINLTIDTELEDGIYFLTLHEKNGVVLTQKLIVSNNN